MNFNKLFDLDSPFMRVMSKMTDMVLLSLLWFVCCLPVITIGPASVALYYVTLKMARGEELKITTTFFRGFKENVKQGIVQNILFLVVGVVLLLDYIIMSAVETTSGMISSAGFMVMGIWMLCIMFYTYPLQAQFYNTIRRTLLNAAILSMRKLGTTVALFALHMLPVILGYVSFEALVRTAPAWVMLAPGLIAFLSSKLLIKIFDPFIKEAAGEKREELEGE